MSFNGHFWDIFCPYSFQSEQPMTKSTKNCPESDMWLRQAFHLAFFQKLKDQNSKTQAIFFQNSSIFIQKLKDFFSKLQDFFKNQGIFLKTQGYFGQNSIFRQIGDPMLPEKRPNANPDLSILTVVEIFIKYFLSIKYIDAVKFLVSSDRGLGRERESFTKLRQGGRYFRESDKIFY